MRTRIIFFDCSTNPISRYKITVFELRPTTRGIRRKDYRTVSPASVTRLITSIGRSPEKLKRHRNGWYVVIHEEDAQDSAVDLPWS